LAGLFYKLTLKLPYTNEAIALGIEINKQVNYRGGQLNRFVSVEYKSDIRRDTSDYLSKNAEQEISIPRAIASLVLVSLLVSISFAFILIRLMS
jgi:hypothetical protein